MKKLLTLLLALLLPCTALAESYTDVAKHYLNTYGKWWDYSQELWLEYAAATRAAAPDSNSTARAIAATEYILPPEGALSHEEAAAMIGHAVGGVCPFGINDGVEVYLDQSMRRFETMFPAAGSANSCIELTLAELEQYGKTDKWVDVCKNRAE